MDILATDAHDVTSRQPALARARPARLGDEEAMNTVLRPEMSLEINKWAPVATLRDLRQSGRALAPVVVCSVGC